VRKIFVIGGAGFLGTSLIKKLDKNFNVDVFCGDVKKSNTSKKNVLIDVEKPETLDQILPLFIEMI
jgi:nucleoside-diphosphate-sugar epimerase